MHRSKQCLTQSPHRRAAAATSAEALDIGDAMAVVGQKGRRRLTAGAAADNGDTEGNPTLNSP